MPCTSFTNISTLGDILVWPTGCSYYLYLIVLATIFITLVLILYNREKEEVVKADIISGLGVSSIAVFLLALIGTLVKNSAGIPMVQQDIFLIIFSFTIIFVMIWFFKR